MRRTLYALSIAVLVALCSAQTAQALTLAVESRPTRVSAYGDTAAWSSYRQGRYVLRVRRGGRTTSLGVPKRSIPFDLDVGPGPDGATWIVYSRCRREPRGFQRVALAALPSYSGGAGCSLRRFSFRDRRERAIADTTGAVLPTIWRGSLAFVRGGARARVFLRSGGATRAVSRNVGVEFTKLDVRGSRVAFGFELEDSCNAGSRPGPFEPAVLSVVAVARARAGQTAAARGCTDETVAIVSQPSLVRDGLVYYEQRDLQQRTFVEPLSARFSQSQQEEEPNASTCVASSSATDSKLAIARRRDCQQPGPHVVELHDRGR